MSAVTTGHWVRLISAVSYHYSAFICTRFSCFIDIIHTRRFIIKLDKFYGSQGVLNLSTYRVGLLFLTVPFVSAIAYYEVHVHLYSSHMPLLFYNFNLSWWMPLCIVWTLPTRGMSDMISIGITQSFQSNSSHLMLIRSTYTYRPDFRSSNLAGLLSVVQDLLSIFSLVFLVVIVYRRKKWRISKINGSVHLVWNDVLTSRLEIEMCEDG